MNQYYLLQIYGNSDSIEYFNKNISEDQAYDIITRFPSWRVKIVLHNNLELKLIIKKIIATETKIESLKNKMSEDCTVYYKDKDNFISITDFDQDDTQEYIYELELDDKLIPESPKNIKKTIDHELDKIPDNRYFNSTYNLIHTLYHIGVIICIGYIINYIL
jgi:hypothetical protein